MQGLADRSASVPARWIESFEPRSASGTHLSATRRDEVESNRMDRLPTAAGKRTSSRKSGRNWSLPN